MRWVPGHIVFGDFSFPREFFTGEKDYNEAIQWLIREENYHSFYLRKIWIFKAVNLFISNGKW